MTNLNPTKARERLIRIAGYFPYLTPDDPVAKLFDEICELLWIVVSNAPDVTPYMLSWNKIYKFGKPILAEYEATSDLEALEKLREIMKTACEDLP